jgi:hypothetical protein
VVIARNVYSILFAATPAADRHRRSTVKPFAALSSVIATTMITVTLVSGCSSSAPSGLPSVSSAKSASTTPAADAASYTQCMRDHGVQMADPDPTTGQPKFDPSVNPDDATVKAALAACQQLLPAGTRSGANSQDLDAYLAFAKCMRANGLPDFPDPQPGPDGLFPNSGVDRNSPTYQKAATACQKYLDQAGASNG